MHNQPSQRSRQPGCPPPRGFFSPTPSSPEPFADLYDRLSRSIHRYFAKRVDDEDTAFDLAAETFAKAFEKRFDFRGSTKARAESWIWGIAHAVLGTYGRTRRVEFEALDRIGLAPEEDPDAPLEVVESQDALARARAQVRDALAELPPDQAEVVRLRLLAELSYTDIASRLGVSNALVRARASRGIRRLKMSDSLRAAVETLEL